MASSSLVKRILSDCVGSQHRNGIGTTAVTCHCHQKINCSEIQCNHLSIIAMARTLTDYSTI